MGHRFATYRTFAEIPAELRDGLAEAYARVFRELPWNEIWERERVAEKLKQELSAPEAIITLLTADEGDGAVGGFCWGAIIPVAEIPQRVREARSLDRENEGHLEAVPGKIRAAQILYVDELALVDRFRAGIGPIASLCTPFLRMADARNVGVICWSTEESKIVPILRAYKFKTVAIVGPLHFFWASHRTVRGPLRAIWHR